MRCRRREGPWGSHQLLARALKWVTSVASTVEGEGGALLEELVEDVFAEVEECRMEVRAGLRIGDGVASRGDRFVRRYAARRAVDGFVGRIMGVVV